MPQRIPRYTMKVVRALLVVTDRIFDTPLGRLGAYVLVVTVAALAFNAQQNTNEDLERLLQESCQAGARFRTEELPAAFAQHDRDLGAALGASDEQIEVFIRDSSENLRQALPARDC